MKGGELFEKFVTTADFTTRRVKWLDHLQISHVFDPNHLVR